MHSKKGLVIIFSFIAGVHIGCTTTTGNKTATPTPIATATPTGKVPVLIELGEWNYTHYLVLGVSMLSKVLLYVPGIGPNQCWGGHLDPGSTHTYTWYGYDAATGQTVAYGSGTFTVQWPETDVGTCP